MFAACIDMDNNGERADFVTSQMRRARKEHVCDECGCKILPGQEYEYASWVYDGRWDSNKTCYLCLRIRASLFHSWLYGGLWEALHEELRWSWTGDDDDDEDDNCDGDWLGQDWIPEDRNRV